MSRCIQSQDCEPGEHEYTDPANNFTTCKVCPDGFISAHDKKDICQWVVKKNRTCEVGEYRSYQSHACSPCPEGTTSKAGAVKMQECRPGNVTAPPGQLSDRETERVPINTRSHDVTRPQVPVTLRPPVHRPATRKPVVPEQWSPGIGLVVVLTVVLVAGTSSAAFIC